MLQSDKVSSVREALEYLVKKESLEDYTCSKTKLEVRIFSKDLLSLKKIPVNLCVGPQETCGHDNIDFPRVSDRGFETNSTGGTAACSGSASQILCV